jgi:hypothetical protein
MTGVSMFGGFGRYGEHGVNVGAGAIASYAYRTGYQLGSDSASSSTSAHQTKTLGAPAARGEMRGANAAPTTAGEWDSHGQTYTVYEHQGA